MTIQEINTLIAVIINRHMHPEVPEMTEEQANELLHALYQEWHYAKERLN